MFYDSKLSGEPTHRPKIRTCPLRDKYAQLMQTMLMRNGLEDDQLAPTDAFFLLDTNKAPTRQLLMEPFAKKEKVPKQFVLYKEEARVMSRYHRVRGVGVVELAEGLHIVTREPLKKPAKKFEEYQGNTAGNMIGPIVMPSVQ